MFIEDLQLCSKDRAWDGIVVAHVVVGTQSIVIDSGYHFDRPTGQHLYCFWVYYVGPQCFVITVRPWGECSCDGGSWRNFLGTVQNLQFPNAHEFPARFITGISLECLLRHIQAISPHRMVVCKPCEGC